MNQRVHKFPKSRCIYFKGLVSSLLYLNILLVVHFLSLRSPMGYPTESVIRGTNIHSKMYLSSSRQSGLKQKQLEHLKKKSFFSSSSILAQFSGNFGISANHHGLTRNFLIHFCSFESQKSLTLTNFLLNQIRKSLHYLAEVSSLYFQF